MKQYPFIFSDERKYRLRRHLAFWSCWMIFFTVLYAYTPKLTLLPDFKRIPLTFVDSAVFMIAHIFFAYSLMYFVIPRYILKGKYVKAAVSVLFIFLITAVISAVISTQILPGIRVFLFGQPYSREFAFVNNSSFFLALLAGLRGGITIGGLAAAIKLMKHWYVKEQRNLQLQKENTEAELQLLKAQIHPHFLFNTLNNIYSFTQNTSAEASGMLTHLSSLLRFILYEGNQPLVPLQKELQMIRDYIDLEKIRYGNQIELHIDLPDETDGYYIAPLLLLPLVENCFKHGTSNMLEQPWIHLQASVRHEQLNFKLLNGKMHGDQLKHTGKGIGIKNVKERLSLLYPEKHELTITEEDEVFIVNLKVQLEIKKDMIRQVKPKTVYA